MSPLKPLNVLLVEDNDEHAYIISRYLKRIKDIPEIRLERAERLFKALDRIQESFFDLILLDLRLPDSDLHETLPKVLHFNPDTPVIILSTLEDREFALKKVHEGAQDYICKSEMSAESLIRGIYAAIERKSSEVQLRRQIEQMRLLFDFSKFTIGEDYDEHIVERLRGSILTGLKVSAAEVVRFESEKVDEKFRQSPVWRLAQPLYLQGQELREKLPASWNLLEEGFFSCLLLPVSVSYSGSPYGLLLILNRSMRSFSEEECQFVQSLTNTLGIALARSYLHKELRKRIDELALAHRLKDDFLATLSHELRTPLNIIKGGLDLLKTVEAGGPEYRKTFETIERNLNKEIQLVADTLDLSRITTGKMRLSVENTDAVQVIESVVESLQQAAAAKGIQIRTELAQSIVGVWDADRFRQVIWNLLSNALKFTPKAGHVTVSCRRTGSMVEINVQDDGIGISAESLPFLFEKFWQADSGINRRRMGLGLGLSIVKHIAELHGGTVSVESPGVGQGTVFHVRLPVNSAVSSVSSAFPSSKRPSGFYENMAARDVSLDGLSIFLLDDSEDTLALLKRLLEKQGAAVTECSLPKKALEMLKVGDYDLLISDIGMPEMDGYEMLKSLRKWEKKIHPGKHIPAIALSAYSADEDIQKAKDSGFQIHISKPSPVRQISSEILRLVHPNTEGVATL